MSLVESLIKEKGLEYNVRGKDVLIHCLNPEHDDSKPSMRVHGVTGMFHCFSCGYKGNVFSYFNRDRSIVNEKVHELQDKIRSIIRSSLGLVIPEGASPFNQPYRGISAGLFKQFNAFLHQDYEDRVVFPITDISGKIVCFNARYLHSNATPKYIVKPEGAVTPLFPPKPVLINNSMVLVEGLFDMLNLQDKGLTNAVCCFGTQKLSQYNIVEKLTPYMIQGVQRIYILFDEDPAGRLAAAKIKEMITLKTEMVVQILSVLPEGKDPGDLTQSEVNYIKKIVS